MAYDCEAGFFTDRRKGIPSMTYSTSGNTYQMDLCMSLKGKQDEKELCGSYLFRMPYVEDIDVENEWNDLVLVENDPIFIDKTIVLHFPFNYEGPRNVALLKLSSNPANEKTENITQTLIKHFSSNGNVSTMSFNMIDHMEAGFHYQIVLAEDIQAIGKKVNEMNSSQRITVVATFFISRDDISNRRSAIAVVLVLLIVLTTLMSILGYIQYLRVKKKHKVDPKR